MTVAERIKVQYPRYPSLADFETVVDRIAKPGAYRRAFVSTFFDEMLKRRMNCNMDGAIREVALKAARSLSGIYEQNVAFDDRTPDPLPVLYENVADFVEKLSFNNTNMKDVIDDEISDRAFNIAFNHSSLKDVWIEEIGEVKDKDAYGAMNSMLDYIELSIGTDEYKSLIIARRELTILVRSYELLIAQVVTKASR